MQFSVPPLKMSVIDISYTLFPLFCLPTIHYLQDGRAHGRLKLVFLYLVLN